MVPVTKKVIAGGNPEKAETKRRPRNQELNSSKTVSSLFRNLRNQRLNCSAGSFDSKFRPYYDTVTEEQYADTIGCDFETLRQIAAKIQEERGDTIVAYVVAKPEYQDAFRESGMECGEVTDDGRILDCLDADEITSERIQDALGSMQGLDSSADSSTVDSELSVLWSHWDVEDDGSVYTHTWIGPDDNSEDCFYVSTRDAQVANAISDAISKSIETTGKEFGWESDPQYANLQVSYSTTFGDSGKTTVGELRNVLESAIQKASGNLDSSRQSVNGSEGELDSACGGKDKLNSSESETVMITTESGNELPITSIKLVQNPDTNELALYVPENDDDEIPEGFAVIGTVISDTAGTPAIEEDVDSAKKESMNCSVEGIEGLEQLPDGEDGYKEYKYRGYTIYCPPDSELDDPADPQKYVIQRKPGDAWGPYTLEECVGQIDSWESEGVNSAKSGVNCAANRAQRRHPNHRKLNSAKRRRK